MPAGWIAGGALSLAGSLFGADAARSGANKAADATKFTPYNVYSGFGSGTFSPATSGGGNFWSRTPGTPASATATLNPQYQALRDQFMQSANGQMGAYNSFDPYAAAQHQYGLMSALSDPNEARARSDLETRLQAQGMLGSTGGGTQQKSLFDSQGQSRIAREIESWHGAQDTLNQMQGRAINSTNAASALDALPLQSLNMGGVFGGRQSAGNDLGARLQFQAAVGRGDAASSFWSGLGQQVAPAISNYANTWRSPYTQQQANDFYGSLNTGMPSGGGGAFNYAGAM